MATAQPDDGPWQLYAKLATPTAVVTGEGWRVAFLNASAQRALKIDIADAMGQVAWPALQIESPDGSPVDTWVADALLPSLDTASAVACRLGGRPTDLSGLWVNHEGRRYVVLTMTAPHGAASDSAASDSAAASGIGAPSEVAPPPDWALRDALTGLYHRGQWDRVFPVWNARGGTAIESLKEIADLGGPRPADTAVLATARALQAEAPHGALLIRYGEDAFVLVLEATATTAAPGQGAGAATALAEAVIARAVADAGMGTPAPALPLHFSYGVAEYEADDLGAAVQRAQVALYARNGVLLRGSRGGSIILSRDGRDRLQLPGAEPEAASPVAPFSANFTAEFAAYFRKVYVRATEQAREFVEIVAPEAGWSVVEVAAGPGRITFDGGLAARIGPSGQLLVTDASAAQIRVARRRAHELDFSWVRFLQAPVEDLPLACGTADLVLGSTFLHYCDPTTAIRAMARVARRGGRVAVNATVDLAFSPAWDAILEPVRHERAEFGLADHRLFPPQSVIEAAFAEAGLAIVAIHRSGRQRADFLDGETAIQIIRQLGLVTLLLTDVPADRHPPIQAAVEERLAAALTRQKSPDETVWTFDTISIVARK